MGWFSKKRNDVVDLTSMEKSGLIARSREIARVKRLENAKTGGMLDLTKINMDNSASSSSSNESALGFLGSFAESASSNSPAQVSPSFSSIAQGMDDNKSKLAKRLMGMTEKLEAQDKEIYTLQQRLELLERKIERLEGRG